MSQPVNLPAAPPVYDVLWQRQVQQAVNTLGGARATVVNVPVAGFAITMPNNSGCLLLQPAGVLATGTVTLPAQAVEGFEVQIASTQTVTALTVVANAGQTLSYAGVVALTAYKSWRFRFVAASSLWVQVA